jgi:hypothetical protein
VAGQTNTNMNAEDAFAEWRKSNPRTFNGWTLGPLIKDNEFLNNRLLSAFMAGFDSGMKMDRDEIVNWLRDNPSKP